MNRVVPLAVVALAASLGLVACGGGSSTSDEDQIRSVADRALTGNDPASCDELLTAHFIQVFYRGSIAQCKKNAEETSTNPDSVDVTNISVDGDKASGDIKLIGGAGDGEVLNTIFLKQSGKWKIDSVSMSSPHTPTTPGSTTGTTGTTATTPSSTGDPVIDLFFATIRSQLQKQGQSAQATDCIVNKLHAVITPADLAALKAGKRPGDLAAKVRQVGTECGHQALAP
jgi:hypothetical protein